MQENCEYSVVVPVFNEEDSLEELHNRLIAVLSRQPLSYEIIYVDDGSTDNTLSVLKRLKSDSGNITILQLRKNYGQSTAFYAGFKKARGKWLITLDADLQNPPEEILKLISFKENYDFIAGIRKERKDNFLKIVSSRVARFFRYIFLKDTTVDTGCSLKMFKREIIGRLFLFKNFHRFFAYLVKERGFSIKEVEVSHQRRKYGTSKYKILKRAKEGLWDIFGILWLKKRFINYEISKQY